MRSSPTSPPSGLPGTEDGLRLVVMAKHPVPGRVKTRLGSAIGADAACSLYRAFIGDLANRLASTGWPVTWAVWPPGAPFESEVPGARCIDQEGATLGERMARATARLLATPGPPVIVIGVDAPHVSLAAIAQAGRVLAAGADVALGPADDGGYWLVGLTAPQPGLFEGIAWSTPMVLEETLDRAQTLGLRVARVPPTFDVDEPADVERLRALIAGGAVDLPRTAAVLATID